MGEITTLSWASSKIESLRTTIPKSIVRFMKLNEGDKLDWDLKAQDNKIILIVTKVEKKVRNEPKPRGRDKRNSSEGIKIYSYYSNRFFLGSYFFLVYSTPLWVSP